MSTVSPGNGAGCRRSPGKRQENRVCGPGRICRELLHRRVGIPCFPPCSSHRPSACRGRCVRRSFLHPAGKPCTANKGVPATGTRSVTDRPIGDWTGPTGIFAGQASGSPKGTNACRFVWRAICIPLVEVRTRSGVRERSHNRLARNRRRGRLHGHGRTLSQGDESHVAYTPVFCDRCRLLGCRPGLRTAVDGVCSGGSRSPSGARGRERGV